MEQNAVQRNEEDRPAPAVSSDRSAAKRAYDGYLDTLQSLLDEATANDHVRELADAVAFAFARIAVGCGMRATVDMMRLLGTYLASLEAQKQAELELARQREEGRLPN